MPIRIDPQAIVPMMIPIGTGPHITLWAMVPATPKTPPTIAAAIHDTIFESHFTPRSYARTLWTQGGSGGEAREAQQRGDERRREHHDEERLPQPQ